MMQQRCAMCVAHVREHVWKKINVKINNSMRDNWQSEAQSKQNKAALSNSTVVLF